MPHFKCCVGGCDSTSNTHRLFCMPSKENLRNLWMSLLVPTNPNLLGLTKDQLVRKRVCERHFDQTQFDHAGVRIRYSYPCLFTEKEIFHGVPLAKGCNFLDEHNYCQSQEQNEDNNNIKEELITMEGDMSQEHDYSIPSTNQPGVYLHLHDEDCIFANLITEITEFDFGESETEYKEIQNSAECNFSEMVEIKKSLQKPTTRNSSTQCHIKQCTKIASDSISNTNSPNLQNVYETKYQGLLQNIEKLDEKAKAFLLMQLKLAGRKKMARRFSSEDKLLALALMKQSPTGYKLLEEIFTLPNKRTLYRLLEKNTLNAE